MLFRVTVMITYVKCLAHGKWPGTQQKLPEQ